MVSDELNVDSSFIIDRMFLPCGRFFSLENKASPTISSCKIIAPFLQRVQDLETCLNGPTISLTVAKDSTLQRVQDLFLGSSYLLVGYLILRGYSGMEQSPRNTVLGPLVDQTYLFASVTS